MLAVTMKVLRRLAAVMAASLVMSWGAMPALAADITIPDPGGAVVGLAYDTASGNLYAVSDVDGGTILVTNDQGERVGTVSYAGAPEGAHALALHEGMLYVGDIAGERSQVTVFRMSPETGDTSYQAYDFEYPDGAHDAKAMLVSGKGRIYIVTDGENPGFYRAELDPSRSSINALTRAADAPAGVTDAVFLSDGATIVLRTAEGIQVVDAYTWETLATTTYVGAPTDESLTSFVDSQLLVGGVELRAEAVPTSDSTITIEGAAPEPTPTVVDSTPAPTETPTAEAPTVEDSSNTPTRRGTVIAIGAAGLLALSCGTLVFARRR